MTKEEIAKLIYVVKAAYPMHFQKYTKTDIENQITAWGMVMDNTPYEVAAAGLKVYMTNDKTGFPPSPGQVIDCIRKTKENPMSDMSALEAWSLVYKAICNSNYNAEAEFNKLPELCQKAIGSADNLKEMAAMDAATVQSVQQSHFIRAYDSFKKRNDEYEKIPGSVKELIGGVAAMLETHE